MYIYTRLCFFEHLKRKKAGDGSRKPNGSEQDGNLFTDDGKLQSLKNNYSNEDTEMIKTIKKTAGLSNILRQIQLLGEDINELNQAEDSELEQETEQADESEVTEDETETADVDDAIETEDGIDENEVADEILENGTEDTSEYSDDVDSSLETDEDETENQVEESPELSEKLDKLVSDFEHFRRKTISLLEAILAASKISIGLEKSEMPRIVKEKKVIATLNTASGKLKKEVAALALRMDEEGALHITQISKVISKGDAVEEELDVQGKIPNGNWIVVERKENYYLVSVDNFNNAENVTPYSNGSEEAVEVKQGKVVNKKGVAHNVRGYELEDKPDHFKLTKASLEKPVKVHNAKWSKYGCDFPIKGEAIPEGTWVIVIDEAGVPFLVSAENVEPKISTKRTEKKEAKKAVKKVTKKIPTKKAVKKVVKKKK